MTIREHIFFCLITFMAGFGCMMLFLVMINAVGFGGE